MWYTELRCKVMRLDICIPKASGSVVQICPGKTADFL